MSLEKLQARWASHQSKNPGGEEQYITAKLDACAAYSEACAGKKIPYRDYVRRTLGIMPAYIAKAEIDSAVNELRDAMVVGGYGSDMSKVPMGQKISDEAQIERLYRSREEEVLPYIKRQLNLSVDVDYKIKFAVVDAYWANWISTNLSGQVELAVNTADSNTWSAEQIHHLVNHEIGAHALQASSIRESIRLGNIHPINGLFLLFAPEQFTLEGVAQTLPLFFKDFPGKAETKITLYSKGVRAMAFCNALLAVADGMELREAAEQMHSVVRWKSVKSIEEDLSETIADPIMRTYRYSYGSSFLQFSSIAEKLSPAGSRRFLKNLYARIYMPQGVRALAGL